MSSKVVVDLRSDEHACVIVLTNERATDMNNHAVSSHDSLKLETMVVFMTTVELFLIPHRPTDSYGHSIDDSKCFSQEATFCLDSFCASSKELGCETHMVPKKQMLPMMMNHNDYKAKKNRQF